MGSRISAITRAASIRMGSEARRRRSPKYGFVNLPSRVMGSKPTVRPPKLRHGNRVALVAPAGPLLERDDLTRAQALCRALGYEPVLAPHAGARYGYLGGTDEERLADLNDALRDPAIDAVWCIRGGF